jgi:hypothetical protein
MKATFRKSGTVTRRVANLRMYGEIVGRRLGINIRSGNISTGCTDGKTVTINFAAFSDEPDAVVLLDGTCTHEFGHVRYTDFLAKTTILKRPLALSFYRSLEDGRMEACEKRDYPGMAVRIEAALEVMVKRGLFDMPSPDEPVEELFPNMLLGWVRGQYLGQKILEPMYRARMSMLCTMVGMPVVKGFLDIARDGLARSRCTKDVVDCSIALEEFLKRELQSMENQQAQAGQDDSSDGSSGTAGQDQGSDQGKAEGKQDTNQDSRDDSQEASGSSKDGKEDDESASDTSRSGEAGSQEQGENGDGKGDDQNAGQDPQDEGPSASGSSQGEQDDNEKNSNGTPSEGSESSSGSQGDAGDPSAASSLQDGVEQGDLDQAIKALAQLLSAHDLPETDLGSLLQEAIDQVAPPDNSWTIREKRALPNAQALEPYAALTRQIELKVVSHLEVLLESRLEERSHLERSGRKLSSRHLASVKSSPQPRVFRIDEDVSGVSTAVSVLLDVSASMDTALADGVSRLHGAVASARAAVSAMDKHEVPCSLHFFGENLTPVKRFEEAWRRIRDLHWHKTEGNTLTGQAVERVVPELATRDEERKLLLLVTDGFPAEPDRTAAALQTCASFGVETSILLINSGHEHERRSLARFTDLLDSFGLSWIEVNTTDQLADGLMQAIRDAV